MNILVIGLNLLRKEIQESRIGDGAEILEIIQDLQESAEVTLELVSDILTQDKIEEGILKLEPSPVSVWSLVTSSVKPFSIQVSQSVS